MTKSHAKLKGSGKPKKVVEKPSKSALSAERVDESEDIDMESSSDETSSSAASAQKTVVAKSKAKQSNGRGTTTTDSYSSSSSSRATNGAKTSEESESESDSGSDSSSGSDSDSGSGSGSESVSEESSGESQAQVEDTLAGPYEPPVGFKPVEIVKAKVSKSTKILNKSSLAGKQLWHIAVPKGIPITEVKELALDKITKGEAIISHKGTDYGLVNDEQAQQDIALLVPEANGYVRAATDFSKSFKMQHVVSLSKLSEDSVLTAKGSNVSTTFSIPDKPARPQPKGLRMRFKPSGFGTADPGTIGSDSEEESTPTTTSKAQQTKTYPPGYKAGAGTFSQETSIRLKDSKVPPPATSESSKKSKKGEKGGKKRRKDGEGQDEERRKKKKKHHEKEAKGS